CHGWAGDGRKMDSQMPDAPNLRESRLNRDRLVMTIKCGRPGTGMPAFDKFAYTDGRCGLKASDLKTPMPDPPATFQQREIELVADFLMRKWSARVRWIAPSASSTGARTSTRARSSNRSGGSGGSGGGGNGDASVPQPTRPT